MKGIIAMSRSPLVRQALIVAVSLIFSANGYAQTTPAARQLLDSMITALGGQQFLDVREIQTSGRFFVFTKGEISQSDLYISYWKVPDMDRIEFGKDKIKPGRINKGLEGWTLTPPAKGNYPDVAKQSAADIDEFLKGFRTSFNYMIRFVANTPKATIVHAGSETIDTKRADILEIRDTQKNLMRVYIDRETRYPVKVQTRLTDEQFTDEWLYANWHKFNGVMTPLLVVRYRDGVKVQETRVETVAYNPGFPDSLFAPPAKSK
jgi:hypothetical protein